MLTSICPLNPQPVHTGKKKRWNIFAPPYSILRDHRSRKRWKKGEKGKKRVTMMREKRSRWFTLTWTFLYSNQALFWARGCESGICLRLLFGNNMSTLFDASSFVDPLHPFSLSHTESSLTVRKRIIIMKGEKWFPSPSPLALPFLLSSCSSLYTLYHFPSSAQREVQVVTSGYK